MKKIYRLKFAPLASLIISIAAILVCHSNSVAQTSPLTYPEIITALNSSVPNAVFKNKAEVIEFLIDDIKKRKVNRPLTPDREDDLNISGATPLLIQTIRENYLCTDREVDSLYGDFKNNRNGTLNEKMKSLKAAEKFVKTFAACSELESKLNEIKSAIPALEEERPSPFDELGNTPQGELKARLDNFFVALQNDPTAAGYVVVSGTDRQVSRKLEFIEAYVRQRNFPPDRITLINGGDNFEMRIQFWILPSDFDISNIL